MVAQPHFLLFCDTHHSDSQSGPAGGYTGSGGRWHFVLEQLDGPDRLEAADSERSMNRERLALLSVVRGLEALEQPSQVSLVTTSSYVSRGLRYGLSSWRESDYTWERFGEQRPVRNSDLWRRVDTALQFHGIKCRLIQAGQSNPGLAQTETVKLEATRSEASGLGTSGLGTSGLGTSGLGTSGLGTSGGRDADRWAACSGLPAESPSGFIDPETANRTLAARPAENTRFVLPTPVLPAAVDSSLANSVRPAGNRAKPWQPAETSGNLSSQRSIWWNLAATWTRWWRGRLQNRQAIYGT